MTESTPKKIIAVDLFCGAGGLTTGLKAAGIDVVGGVEFDSDAANTYRANHPHTHLFQQDIKSLSGNDILKTLGVAKIDLLAGCPPCQGFSSLTFKNKKEDPRNFLILEFLRLVRELNPQVIMLENVPGLAKRGLHLFQQFLDGIRAEGYIPDFRVLQVADFGVPQKRRRLVMLAGKNFQIPIPKPQYAENAVGGLKKWVSLKEAIGNMPKPFFVSDLKEKSYASVNWNVARHLSDINLKRLQALCPGASRYDIPKKLRPKCHQNSNSGFGNVYGRLKWDEPSVTITRGCITLSMGRFGHPEQDRALSVREAATIQTFPKNYKFAVKNLEKACLQIGNAFPCLLAKHLGEQVNKYYKENNYGRK